MMYYSDDPVRDAERYMEDQERRSEQRPVCSDCGYTIYDDHYYQINDEVICRRCLDHNYRKQVEDFI